MCQENDEFTHVPRRQSKPASVAKIRDGPLDMVHHVSHLQEGRLPQHYEAKSLLESSMTKLLEVRVLDELGALLDQQVAAG